ncbi:ATP-binding protein [Streptomyces sp. B5E4]|uniref:ATP-binding protein n=1 Tax=Streptomyces sp. B5E4 TaxID=3153568 RepID=UPI00325EEE72
MTTTPTAALTPAGPPFTTWGRTYAPSPRTAHLARMDIADTLGGWGVDATTIRDAMQVVAELAGNAVRHGHVPGRHFFVRVTRGGGRLQLEVDDAEPAPPVLTRAPDDAEEGRGLRIVDALADAWGVTPRPGGIGKTVWAVILYGTVSSRADSAELP